MRLKRLELQGFKSFLDRTILSFDSGITGVVGPNGCGKSNIVDAILWVMGEQSPKHLRGDSMSDIIFNGSDTKLPTSVAEVSLILDRQGVMLNPQFGCLDGKDEISVTRRFYRDGQGEFFINKIACRLRDIHELFMDTGVGRRTYSIIEQGQIDQMINSKPEDRRSIFEEAAGITKYKAKRKEAEKKLELTRQNVSRLVDIISELEKQIRSLKIQATRARRYKEFKVELEVTDTYLIGRNLFRLGEVLKALTVQREQLSDLRVAQDTKLSEIEAEISKGEVQRIDQEKACQEFSDRERELLLSVQRQESQLAVVDEQRKHISKLIEGILEQSKLTQEKLVAGQSEYQRTQKEKEECESQLFHLLSEVRRREEILSQFLLEKERLISRKEEGQDQLGRLTSQLVVQDSQKEATVLRREEFLKMKDGIHERLTKVLTDREKKRGEFNQVEIAIEACLKRSRNAEQEVIALDSEWKGLSAELSELEEEQFSLRENYHTKKSRRESLVELQRGLEGYSPTARQIILELEGNSWGAVPLAEILTPESEIEDALEALLGGEINTLLVSTKEQAESLAQFIDSRGLEKVRILALSEVPPHTPRTSFPDNGVPFLSKLRVQMGYERAADWCLGHTYVCESPSRLLDARTAYPGVRFLTPDAKWISHADGSITCGTPPARIGIFARRREIDELEVLCRELESDLAKSELQRQSLMGQLEAKEELKTACHLKLSSIHIESVEYRKEREKVQIELNRLDTDHHQVMEDSIRNSGQLEEATNKIEVSEQKITSFTVERDRLEKEQSETQADLTDVTAKEKCLAAENQEDKIALSKIEEKVLALSDRVNRLDSENYQAEQQAISLKEQKISEESQFTLLEQNEIKVREMLGTLNEQLQDMILKLSEMKAQYVITCERVGEKRCAKDVLQKQRDQSASTWQDLSLKFASEQSNLEHLKGISVERYQREASPIGEEISLELAKLPLLSAKLDTHWNSFGSDDKLRLLQEHVQAIREKIDRYGEVNLTAIQEFDEIQKRFDFLSSQKDDLENSVRILEEAIKRIDESTKSRFTDTFEAVNKKFQEIFPILFSGGKASLVLVDSGNILESGVDVMVQPPGKRPQSISLLSGGEKALTAVSLILAIFARKPSPFCLLDEVDAPLDDANVSRFNTVVRKMAERSQFILITHNKKTMEIADALYGVTMERAGVSKMTSVRLN